MPTENAAHNVSNRIVSRFSFGVWGPVGHPRGVRSQHLAGSIGSHRPADPPFPSTGCLTRRVHVGRRVSDGGLTHLSLSGLTLGGVSCRRRVRKLIMQARWGLWGLQIQPLPSPPLPPPLRRAARGRACWESAGPGPGAGGRSSATPRSCACGQGAGPRSPARTRARAFLDDPPGRGGGRSALQGPKGLRAGQSWRTHSPPKAVPWSLCRLWWGCEGVQESFGRWRKGQASPITRSCR